MLGFQIDLSTLTLLQGKVLQDTALKFRTRQTVTNFQDADNFIEHACAYARWAHMHRFLSVCPSVCDLTKIQTRK